MKYTVIFVKFKFVILIVLMYHTPIDNRGIPFPFSTSRPCKYHKNWHLCVWLLLSAWILARWWSLLASTTGLNLLHWVMYTVSHHRHSIVIVCMWLWWSPGLYEALLAPLATSSGIQCSTGIGQCAPHCTGASHMAIEIASKWGAFIHHNFLTVIREGTMRSESLPNGDIQCLLGIGKPWTISIGSEVCT